MIDLFFTIDITVCHVIDMAIDNKLMRDGNEPTSCKKEALKERIKYLKHLLYESENELDEIESLEEAEKYI